MKPNIPSNLEYYYEEYFGFGFDPLTEDYKVVLIKGYKISTAYDYWEGYLDHPLSIMIYSLKTDSWRYVGDLSKSYYLKYNQSHVFADTSYYWLGSSQEEYTCTWDVMIALDLATEVWQEIVLPKSRIVDNKSYDESLIVYHNSIALIAFYCKEDNDHLDVWTLKDKFWSKDLTVELGFRIGTPLGHYYFTNNNNFMVFQDRGGLNFWDSKTEKILELESWTISGSCRTISAYVESLVPLNDRDFWEQNEEPHVVLS